MMFELGPFNLINEFERAFNEPNAEHLASSSTQLQPYNNIRKIIRLTERYMHQGFKFRFDSHFGLDTETEYFVFRIVSVYHFGVHRIYIYIYIYFNIEYYIT